MRFLRSVVADARSRKSASGPADSTSTAAASNGRGSSRSLSRHGPAADPSPVAPAKPTFFGPVRKHGESRVAGRLSERATIAPRPLHDQASSVVPPSIVSNPPADSTPASTPPAPAAVTDAPNEIGDPVAEPTTSVPQVEPGAQRDRPGRSDEAALSSSAESAIQPEADTSLSVPAVNQVPEYDCYARAGGLPERTVERRMLETLEETSAKKISPTSNAPAGWPGRASTSKRSEIHSESPRGEHRSVFSRPNSSREPESIGATAGSVGEAQRFAPAPSVSNEMPSGGVVRPSKPDSRRASGRAAPRQASGPPSESPEGAGSQARGATLASGGGRVSAARPAYAGREATADQLRREPAGPAAAAPPRVLRERDGESGAPPAAGLAGPSGPASSQPEKQAASRVEPPHRRPASQPLPQPLPPAKAASDKSAARPEPTAIWARAVQNTSMPRQDDRSQTFSTAPRTPEVKIGQVDVFFEAPRRADGRGASPERPSVSLASRFYLRRL